MGRSRGVVSLEMWDSKCISTLVGIFREIIHGKGFLSIKLPVDILDNISLIKLLGVPLGWRFVTSARELWHNCNRRKPK